MIGYKKGEVGELIARGGADLALGVFPNPPEGSIVTPVTQDRFIGLARRGQPTLGGVLTVEGWGCARPRALWRRLSSAAWLRASVAAAAREG